MDGKQIIENVNTAVSTGKVIAKYVSNTSLTKLAKDSIFQFPVIISASIDNDEIFVMAKSFERSYASMMVSVISMSSYIDLNKYGKEDYLVNFLRRFHSNTNIGSNIIASESVGINVVYHKLLAFVIAAFFAGVAALAGSSFFAGAAAFAGSSFFASAAFAASTFAIVASTVAFLAAIIHSSVIRLYYIL